MTALNCYLDQVRNRPFAWGVHDCLIFTNTAWHLMHGRGWADDWLGRYLKGGVPLGRASLKREFGHGSFAEALAARLSPVAGVPPRGALVASENPTGWGTGLSLGIALGARAVFVGERGTEFEPIGMIAGAWVQ